MLKRSKKWFADDFSYFIRYFGVFTLIFMTMTLIIIQVMRNSLYTSADENLKSLSENPASVLNIGYMHLMNPETAKTPDSNSQDLPGINEDDKKEKTGEGSKTPPSSTSSSSSTTSKTYKKYHHDGQPPKVGLDSNTEVVLFDEDGKVLEGSAPFLKANSVPFSKYNQGRIVQVQVQTSYGKYEKYRELITEVDEDDQYQGVQYAAILVNVTQLEEASQKHESLIVMVMISFWLISTFASVYLARVSAKPLLESIQKQKAFVENASHELRTPLAVLQNRLESLFRKPEATILESSENIASSLEEVRNMRMLTTNLLNLARRDDGIVPEIGEVEVAFFDQTFANYAIVAEENGKEFTYENAVTKPILTDRTLLKQLMTILFDNAVKYTDEDGTIRLELALKDRDRQLVLRVLDNGPGISTLDKKRIFDRFYRVDKARTRQQGGFGLGLSLAKQIADALKGTILVKDNKPKGTIFEVRFTLPRK